MEIVKRLEWIEGQDAGTWRRSDSDVYERTTGVAAVVAYDSEESLHRFVIQQLDIQKLSSKLYDAACFVAECLDENGYLEDSAEELAKAFGTPIELMEKAIDVIRGLEPPGIGARDLVDCLCLQLSETKSCEGNRIRLPERCIEKTVWGLFLKRPARRRRMSVRRSSLLKVSIQSPARASALKTRPNISARILQ
jgi:RNA polymerase sigma-54 factor